MIPRRPSEYLAYKKNKITTPVIQENKKTISKFNFLVQLFIATFVIIFITIVFVIMRYSQKVDIEYSKDAILQNNNDSINNSEEYSNVDDEQQKIDKRLILIQQEEDAPSEAKLTEKKQQNTMVIDPKLIEETKKIDKQNAKKEVNSEKSENDTKKTIKNTTENTSSSKVDLKPEITNQIIMSKILIGKYATFEEAQKNQIKIKATNPTFTPYVKKLGEVYAIQVGSYQDFYVAKTQAQKLKAKGYEVWIYQQ